MPNHISLLTRDTIALILAGGKGSRLKQLTAERAKPVVPFGGKYKVIDFTLSNCMNSGVRKVNILTHHNSLELITHVQKAWSRLPWELGEYINIVPAEQKIGGLWYPGTAGAVYQNLKIIRKQDCKYVLILGGDHIYKMDYSRMLRHHAKHNADISIASMPIHCDCASSFGVLNIDTDMRIKKFQEKPVIPTEIPGQPGLSLVSMGIYIFNFDILVKLLEDDAALEGSLHDFGHNIIPKAVRDYCVTSYIFNDEGCADVQAYWKDIGTIDQYFQANLDLVKINPELNLYDTHWPIYSFSEQLPGAKFIFKGPECCGQALDSVVCAGTIISGARVEDSLIFTKVTIEQYTFIKNCVVLPNVTIGRCCHLRNALITDDCILPDGISIGYDDEIDNEYFDISENGVIVVTQEMIDNYVRLSHDG